MLGKTVMTLPSHADSQVAREIRRSLTWRRLAEPQADLYDSEAVLMLAAGTTTPGRTTRFLRTTPFARLTIGPVFSAAEQPPGRWRLYTDAPPEHPSIEEAIDLLRGWPEGVAQVRHLVERIHPALDLTCPAILPLDRIRSSSHSMESHFGALWATVNSAPGLAQSIVHEMAHQKLWAFGVSFEGASAILANDPSGLYWSPLVAWPRSLAAVLHAHYALLHIAALDCTLLVKARSRTMRAAFVRSAIRHLQLLSRSASVLRKHAIVDESGALFLAAMWDWMDRVRQEGRRHAG